MNKGAQLVREWRRIHSKSQYELGILVGLNPATAGQRMSTFEAGRVIPDAARLARFEDVTGVPMRAWTEPAEQDQAKAS